MDTLEKTNGSTASTVFLMHGILNLNLSMRRIEKALAARGFDVVNLDYPSRSKSIEEHARWLSDKVARHGRGTLHFVGHSLGAIIIRYCLAHFEPRGAARLVMIAPPNQGSLTADRFGGNFFYKLLYGQAGQQLRASRRDFWDVLPAPRIEFGIIAGATPYAHPWLPGDHDGTISASEAHLDGAKAFITLPYQHTGILFRKETLEQTIRFLETGHFSTAPQALSPT